MIIRFYNLGKIKETTLDLRPLTVIIGPNNSNKTYIAYSLYGLWQAEQDKVTPLDDIVERAFHSVEDNTLRIPVDQILQERLQTHSDQMCERFAKSLASYYQDSTSKLFSDSRFHLAISLDDVLDMLPRLSGQKLYIIGGQIQASAEGNVIKIKYSRSSGPSNLDAEAKDAARIGVDLPLGMRVMVSYVIQNLLFPEPFLLPAERNSFVLTYKLLTSRRYQILRDSSRDTVEKNVTAQRRMDLLARELNNYYPQPVEDFLDFLVDMDNATQALPRINVFTKLADTIENTIQGGNKTRLQSTALGRRLITQVRKGLDIDLHNASSSIKQLAPLLLYLRYRARENDLLIIDEPEMNLHPESQAKLLEVLAMLVNHGVNVLLTTHSPYLMAHLNNLAQADDTSQAVRNRQAKSLYLKNPDSLLRMDQVSAYEMRDNQLHSLKDPDYGIRWDTLSDVSADLQQKYFAIYEEGHAKERARNGRKTTAAKAKDRQPTGGQAGEDQP